MKNRIQIFVMLTFIFILGCKDNFAQHKEIQLDPRKKTEQKKDSVKKNSSIENNLVDLQLIDITRFFDNPVINSDYENFKKNRISLHGDHIIINSKKAHFTIGEIDTQKRLGKGSRYEYYTEYLSSKYNIDISKKFPYLNISDENAFEEPFRKYFYDGSALYIDDYLFFYTDDDYLLTYRINNSSSFSHIYNSLPEISLPLQYSYDFLNDNNFGLIPAVFQKKLRLEYYDSNFRGAKLPIIKGSNKIIPVLIYAYDETGQSKLYLYTFSQEFEVLDRLELYYSYDIDSGNVVTTYSINKEYSIEIQKTKHQGENSKIIESVEFIVNNKGKFERRKK